ncbi:hypothetical protein CPC08DRAFT_480560 [Agrocybe pediades]|nr:hypothetical protein CPC08DRAFT_480560 [Agrocybe pediades]
MRTKLRGSILRQQPSTKEQEKTNHRSFCSSVLQESQTWKCWGRHLGQCRGRDTNAPGKISRQPEHDFASKFLCAWAATFPCFLTILRRNKKNCVARRRLCLRNGCPIICDARRHSHTWDSDILFEALGVGMGKGALENIIESSLCTGPKRGRK